MMLKKNSTGQFEFCFPQLDTLILVEELATEVVIRATRNTFSEQRKIYFIRELAAEGFISDNYRWVTGFDSFSWLRVHWLLDASWLEPCQVQIARSRKFMIRLLAFTALLWLAMMTALFHSDMISRNPHSVSTVRNTRAPSGQQIPNLPTHTPIRPGLANTRK
jgi:hypothetical protein